MTDKPRVAPHICDACLTGEHRRCTQHMDVNPDIDVPVCVCDNPRHTSNAEYERAAPHVAAVSPSEPNEDEWGRVFTEEVLNATDDLTRLAARLVYVCAIEGDLRKNSAHMRAVRVVKKILAEPAAAAPAVPPEPSGHFRETTAMMGKDGERSGAADHFVDADKMVSVPPEPTPVGLKESPRPWRVVSTRNGEAWLLIGDDGEKIALANCTPNAEQNLRFIAATVNRELWPAESRAPAEVLEALKRDVLARIPNKYYGVWTTEMKKDIAALFDAAVKESTKWPT